jgi:hypothetical protein
MQNDMFKKLPIFGKIEFQDVEGWWVELPFAEMDCVFEASRLITESWFLQT